jgi:hypothetical protein
VRGENRRRGEGIWLVTYDGDWRETFRPDIPSVARIYDYLLGGKDNYPADRAVGESMIAQLPNVRLAVQWNRACPQARVVYIDHDPIVLAHARSMLHGVPGAAVIGRDMLEPDTILADPAVAAGSG